MDTVISIIRKILCCSQDSDESYSYPTFVEPSPSSSCYYPSPPVQSRWNEAQYTLPTRLDLPNTYERFKYDTQGRGRFDDMRYDVDISERNRKSHVHLLDIKWGEDDTFFADNYNRHTGNFM